MASSARATVTGGSGGLIAWRKSAKQPRQRSRSHKQKPPGYEPGGDVLGHWLQAAGLVKK